MDSRSFPLSKSQIAQYLTKKEKQMESVPVIFKYNRAQDAALPVFDAFQQKNEGEGHIFD